MVRVCIHQPNYAPWCGFFAKLAAADVFVFLDDAQLPRGRSYVTRTQVLGDGGAQWLTVPVRHVDAALPGEQRSILAARTADPRWAQRHLRTLRARYGRTPFFAEVFGLIAPLYEAADGGLAQFNERLVRVLAEYLGLKRQLLRSSELGCAETGDERLIALTKAVGGDTYLSGPSGPKYQAADKFSAAGLGLQIRTYVPIPYPQGRAFVPGLSVLDALFRCGPQAAGLLRYPETAASLRGSAI